MTCRLSEEGRTYPVSTGVTTLGALMPGVNATRRGGVAIGPRPAVVGSCQGVVSGGRVGRLESEVLRGDLVEELPELLHFAGLVGAFFGEVDGSFVEHLFMDVDR